MGVLLGRLFTVIAVVLGTAGCERRHPVTIGVAFGEDARILSVVQEELRRRYGDDMPHVRPPSSEVAEGAPGAVTLATQLTQMPGLIGVVGHADSRGSLAAAPVYDEHHIPLLVPTATSRRLQTVSSWVFMMSPDDSVEAEYIATFASGPLHSKAVAVFYDNDEYGIGLRDALHAALKRRGLSIIAEEPVSLPCGPPETMEASVVRAAPAGHHPDLVVIAARTRDAACLGRRLSERVRGLRIIGGDAVENDSSFDARYAPAVAPFYAVAVWAADAADSLSVEFAREFRRIVGTAPKSSQALVFDAIMILAQAAREAGTRPDAVRRYLSELGVSRPAYPGLTGAVSFGPAARRPLHMLRVGVTGRGSRPVVVE